MEAKPDLFDSYVIRDVLAKNTFEITQVNNLACLKQLYFLRREYEQIEKLINAGNIEAIKALPGNLPESEDFKEFLVIYLFNDQNDKKFVVTVYDSIALEQDPEVIKIYPFPV